MESKRNSVIDLYLARKQQMASVFRTISHYRDTGTIASYQKSGRKKKKR